MSDKLCMVLTSINQTCFACPSQWDAETECGKSLYIRYRWGHLTVSDRALGLGVDIFSLETDDLFDGVMSTEEMLETTGLTLK